MKLSYFLTQLFNKPFVPSRRVEIVSRFVIEHGVNTYFRSQQDSSYLKKLTLSYINSLEISSTDQYLYSHSCKKSTIYSNMYVCLIKSLYDDLDNKGKWIKYFDSFQAEKDGLFYDKSIHTEQYSEIDWWGGRHFALHAIPLYTALGTKPKYPFRFLKEYYKIDNLKKVLDAYTWKEKINNSTDIDNWIMNIGAMLQYQRDVWNDKDAGESILWLLDYLSKKVDKATGLWGIYDPVDFWHISRQVQFAYHLYSLLFYDKHPIINHEKIIDIVLSSQGLFGGYGTKINSSACEDIDAIDLLIRLSEKCSYRKEAVEASLNKVMIWILANMNHDGGFVFRRSEAFEYGHKEMSSLENESALFPTWFRTLSIAFIQRYFNNITYKINRSPGLEF